MSRRLECSPFIATAIQVLPLLATHNTVRMRFDVEAAEYLNLARTDASFPPVHFAMLADDARNQVSTCWEPWPVFLNPRSVNSHMPRVQLCVGPCPRALACALSPKSYRCRHAVYADTDPCDLCPKSAFIRGYYSEAA